MSVLHISIVHAHDVSKQIPRETASSFDDNKGNFHEAGECHIRNKDIIVRDHCHVTGKYGGSAHSSHFYLTFKLTDKILVILHNLRGYDSHFIMQQIAKLNQDIKVLPN